MAKLTKKEFLLNIVVPIGTFLLGLAATILFTIVDPSLDRGVIAKNKSNGRYQQKVKELPSVKSFLDYLNTIEAKDTSRIWDHMTPGFQKVCGSKENLLYWYYLTSSYEVKYIILDTEEHFYVFLRFEDNIMANEVQNIKQFTNTNKFSEIIKGDTLPAEFLSEIYKIIDSRFKIEDTNQVKNEIKDYVGGMTMQEIVTKDWRFPMLIAAKLKLKEKGLDREQYSKPQSHDMIMEVFMEKEGDDWKVKQTPTLTLSRWE